MAENEWQRRNGLAYPCRSVKRFSNNGGLTKNWNRFSFSSQNLIIWPFQFFVLQFLSKLLAKKMKENLFLGCVFAILSSVSAHWKYGQQLGNAIDIYMYCHRYIRI
jgi:hypothetical protein